MKPVLDLLGQGGFVMIPIVTLSVLLYSRCFRLLLALRRSRRELGAAAQKFTGSTDDLRRWRGDVQAMFRRQRVALGAMIAAAPLLGLLGTVTGMEKTFSSLSTRSTDRSMEGLARGISEVLVATESGLTVAIPALLLVYLAHREVHRHLQMLTRIERGLPAGGVR
jgi:biopolymer transport protein ExbB